MLFKSSFEDRRQKKRLFKSCFLNWRENKEARKAVDPQERKPKPIGEAGKEKQEKQSRREGMGRSL